VTQKQLSETADALKLELAQLLDTGLESLQRAGFRSTAENAQPGPSSAASQGGRATPRESNSPELRSDLADEVQGLRHEFTDSIEDLRAGLTQLAKRCDHASGQADGARHDVDTVREELAAVASRKSFAGSVEEFATRQDHSELRRYVDESRRQDLEDSRKALRQVTPQDRTMTMDKVTEFVRREIGALETQQRRAVEVDATREELLRNEEQLEAVSATLEELQQTTEKNEKALAEVISLKKEMKRLWETVNLSKENVALFKDDSEEKMMAFEQEVDILRKEFHDFKEQTKDGQANCVSLEKEVRSIATARAGNLSIVGPKDDTLELMCKTLEKQMIALRGRCESVEFDVKDLSQISQEARSSCASLENQVVTLERAQAAGSPDSKACRLSVGSSVTYNGEERRASGKDLRWGTEGEVVAEEADSVRVRFIGLGTVWCQANELRQAVPKPESAKVEVPREEFKAAIEVLMEDLVQVRNDVSDTQKDHEKLVEGLQVLRVGNRSLAEDLKVLMGSLDERVCRLQEDLAEALDELREGSSPSPQRPSALSPGATSVASDATHRGEDYRQEGFVVAAFRQEAMEAHAKLKEEVARLSEAYESKIHADRQLAVDVDNAKLFLNADIDYLKGEVASFASSMERRIREASLKIEEHVADVVQKRQEAAVQVRKEVKNESSKASFSLRSALYSSAFANSALSEQPSASSAGEQSACPERAVTRQELRDATDSARQEFSLLVERMSYDGKQVSQASSNQELVMTVKSMGQELAEMRQQVSLGAEVEQEITDVNKALREELAVLLRKASDSQESSIAAQDWRRDMDSIRHECDQNRLELMTLTARMVADRSMVAAGVAAAMSAVDGRGSSRLDAGLRP